MGSRRSDVTGLQRAVICPLLFVAGFVVNAGAEETPITPQTTTVPVEVFQAPKIKSTPPPGFPASELAQNREGWVIVNMMIDPKGKPYEATVVDSTGNSVFEQAAVKAVTRNFTFEPATRAGTAIDSSFTIKVIFSLKNMENGANRRFVSAYRDLQKAIEKSDRNLANQALAQFKVQNLYEDAFRHVANFYYHRKWGSEAEQLTDLNGAVAGENAARYLNPTLFRSVLMSKFGLEIKAQDFGSALETWKILKPIALPKDVAVFQSAIDQVIAIRNSDTVFRLPGQISRTTSWNGRLLKRRFEISVADGHVSDIKLRCEKQYVLFKYEAGIQYSVSPTAGDCNIELVGDPGTTFQLIQS